MWLCRGSHGRSRMRTSSRPPRIARRFWGLNDHSISNMVWLIENHGGLVGRMELGSEKLDAFSQWNREESTPYFILGSDKESAARSRYNLAHELGHLSIHRNVSRDLFADKAIFKLIESQANRFAGCFLLPESTFGAEFVRRPTLDLFRSLKNKWNVSIQLMIMRCSDLGIISPTIKRGYLPACPPVVGVARSLWTRQSSLRSPACSSGHSSC